MFGDALDPESLTLWKKKFFFLSTGEVSCLFVKFWYECERKPSYSSHKVFIRKNLSKSY